MMPKKKTQTLHDISAGRDAILGDQINNLTVVLQMGAFTPPPDLRELRRAYLEHLRNSYRALDFKGIPQLRTLPAELMLEDVYVPLVARPELPAGETWERRLAGRAMNKAALPEEALAMMEKAGSAVPVRVEEALAHKAQVVVLGDPGSGKSTLLKHLALRLASEPDAPLPILVPLNAFAGATGHNLQAFLPEYFAGRTKDVAALGPLFDSALAQGKAVILLDGLDEVQSERAFVVNKVESFAREAAARGNKLAVTSRIVGYREAALNPKDWALYTLLDFDRDAIEQFVNKWCPAFEKSTLGDTPEARAAAEEECAGLLDAIDANPGVARLASNPLLLTILALIKRQGVELPKSRVKLYDRYLETLIEAWNKARSLDKKSGGESLDYTGALNVLGPLALKIREENPAAGLVAERQLLRWLADYYKGDEWGLKPGPALQKAGEFLNSVRRDSNLLVERGEGQYGFIHLTFEEALAAYGLVSAGQLDLSRSLAVIQGHLADPGWRETILLAVGVWGLLNRQPLVAGEVARAMLKMKPDADSPGQNVLLAGACLEDVGAEGLGRAAANEVMEALLAASRNRALPPAVQRDAGFSLGRAGWKPDDLDRFIAIPAGSFLYGDKAHPVTIAQPFAIAKYPVTNLQYRRFVEAKGYDRRDFWSDEGWAWRTGTYQTKAKEDYEKLALEARPPEKRGEPFWWRDQKWNNPLAPVVGVSWFEAEAYANWLGKEMGKPIRLPAEEEWERAARHTDGREYPWGKTFDRNRLNCAEFWGGEDDLSDMKKWSDWVKSDSFKSASTTSVGQFPEGNSETGLSDMSGNVWEWTGSWYDREQVYRTLRGGSWTLTRRNARCAFRNGTVPDTFSLNIGFRLFSPAL
jgi:formylglycine-generating enzyme required for sulfatase activity/energy-coupling factor transporter ATP-binding protein EcfA2